MDEPVRSPLARLVLFMVCLSIAGTILGGVHYVVVDIPAQASVHPPENFDSGACTACLATCGYKFWDTGCEDSCLRSCDCNPRCYYA
jgi:hypothetical protein